MKFFNNLSVVALPLLLFFILLNGCALQDPSGPSSWTLKGKVAALSDQLVDFKSGRLRIGAFPSNSSSFKPEVDNLEATIGSTAILPDSSFQLTLHAEKGKTDYLIIVVWHDSDGDERLDAQSEPYEMATEQHLFHGTALTYQFDERENSWLSTFDKEKSASHSQLMVILKKNQIGSLREWSLSGTIQSDSSEAIQFDSQKIAIGLFLHSSSSPTPPKAERKAEGGWAKVQRDGTFEMKISIPDNKMENGSFYAWYDADGDGVLNPKQEQSAVLFAESLTNELGLAYRYDSYNREWQEQRAQRIATTRKSVLFKTDKSLAPVSKSWSINGKVKVEEGKSVDFKSDKLMLGAFRKSTPLIEEDHHSLQPLYGSTAIARDSSFHLPIAMIDQQMPPLTLRLWYDADGNGKLDSIDEPHSTALFYSGALQNKEVTFQFDTTALIWKVSSSSEPISSLSHYPIKTSTNMVGARNRWSFSSKLVAAEDSTLDLASQKVRVGAFTSTSSALSFSQNLAQPYGRSVAVQPNGHFTLQIEVSSPKPSFLHLVAWQDLDGDDALQTDREPYAQLELPSRDLSRKIYFNYSQTTQEWLWNGEPVSSFEVDAVIFAPPNRNSPSN